MRFSIGERTQRRRPDVRSDAAGRQSWPDDTDGGSVAVTVGIVIRRRRVNIRRSRDARHGEVHVLNLLRNARPRHHAAAALVCRARRTGAIIPGTGRGYVRRAITALGRGLQTDPSSTRAHFQLGATYVRMGRMDEAIAELETAVGKSERNARLAAYLGYAYAAAGRRDDAIRIPEELESLSRRAARSSTRLRP
jgi:tetratricopeptide (TPR) repeat protein